jgi:hypothetical protein
MAAKNARVMTVLDRSLYEHLRRAARSEGISISAKARDMLRRAAEIEEDAYWARMGNQRLRSFRRKAALRDRDVWG